MILVEAAPCLLVHLSAESSASAQRQLEHLGAEVGTGCLVQNIQTGRVELPGEQIEARNIIWTAGVSAAPLTRQIGADAESDVSV